jgi:hypothetical protein
VEKLPGNGRQTHTRLGQANHQGDSHVQIIMRLRLLAFALGILAACSDEPTGATQCGADTVRVALTDLGGCHYRGYAGGLYPNGSNAPPAAHRAEGLRRAALVRPLDVNGNPASNGRIVFLSIGMSNGTQEFCGGAGYVTCQSWSFLARANADPAVDHTTLAIVNGARGGQVASVWATSASAEYDRIRDQGLAPNGLSERQVQVVWTKLANSTPRSALPNADADARLLERSIGDVVSALKARYPNLQLVFMSSRTYAGFASTSLNPEPYAYETGFAHKWAIESQITSGDYSGAWIGWGPYLWAGEQSNPRSDGLFYVRSDFQNDGTHPSQAGQSKIADLMLQFFKTSELTRPWFLADPS